MPTVVKDTADILLVIDGDKEDFEIRLKIYHFSLNQCLKSREDNRQCYALKKHDAQPKKKHGVT